MVLLMLPSVWCLTLLGGYGEVIFFDSLHGTQQS